MAVAVRRMSPARRSTAILEVSDKPSASATVDGRTTLEVIGPGARRAVRDLAPDAEILAPSGG